MLQLSAIIHDKKTKKTTNLPTPEFHIKKKELKRKKKKNFIFDKDYFCQLILLFSLFLLLFMGPTALLVLFMSFIILF